MYGHWLCKIGKSWGICKTSVLSAVEFGSTTVPLVFVKLDSRDIFLPSALKICFFFKVALGTILLFDLFLIEQRIETDVPVRNKKNILKTFNFIVTNRVSVRRDQLMPSIRRIEM